MAGQSQQKDKVVRIKVLTCTVGFSGKNSRGDDYTIYEIEAENGEGKLIGHKLRSFSPLPINQVVDVIVKKFKSEQYGDSYTLTPVKKGAGAEAIEELTQKVNSLEGRVAELEQRLAMGI